MHRRHPRIRLVVLLFGIISFALAGCSSPSQAQHITVIGIVNLTTGFDPIVTGFKASMADAGFVEGKTVSYVYNGALAIGTDANAIDAEIQKVASQNPDLYLTLGSLPTYRVKDVLQKVGKYGVFVPVTNPEKLGLVNDIRKPGGRLTGLNSGGPLTAKGLEWFITSAPNVKRVTVYYLHGDPTAPTQFATLKATAATLKVELVLHEVQKPDEAIADLPSLSKETDGVLMIAPTIFATAQQQVFIQAALKQGIPIGTTIFGGVANGQLTGLSANYDQLGKQAAELAQQILHGADPGTLPVQPAQFNFEINLATASTLGMTIPDTVLQQADRVVRTIATPQATQATPQATSSR